MAVRVSVFASPAEANNIVLTTTEPIAYFGDGDNTTDTDLADLSRRIEATPGLAAAGRSTLRGPHATSSVLADLRRRFQNLDSGRRLSLAVRTEALREVGGFNPLRDHQDWPDLIARLRRRGWTVDDIGPGLPFIDELHPGSRLVSRLASEIAWLENHGPAGTISARRYRALIGAVITLDGRHHPDRAALAKLAVNGIDRPKPHEVQAATGWRADWRFLLPDHRYQHLLVLVDPDDDRTEPDRWEWLRNDGWVDTITINPDSVEPDWADVVLAGGPDHLTRAHTALRGGRPVVLERGGPYTRFTVLARRTGSMDERFVAWRRYLARPSVARPRKLVPLDHPAGLDWLAEATLPPLPVDLTAPKRLRSALGPGMVTAMSTLGSTVAIGFKPPVGDVGTAVAGAADVIVVTSGFDEGSRAILLPLVGRAATERPASVLKLASRPRYNVNSRQELAAVTAVRSRLSDENLGLVPDSVAARTLGELAGSAEPYLGSCTLSDTLFRRRAERRNWYRQAAEALVAVAADLSDRHEWTPAMFDRFVAGPMAQFIETVQPAEEPVLIAWLDDLRQRSDRLVGHPVGLGMRHFDLGPWNIMTSERPGATGDDPDRAPSITIIDWEIAPPRSIESPGLVAADLVYFTKYWLHIAEETESFEDELDAFAFLDADGVTNRGFARRQLTDNFDRLGVDPGFIPLYTAHVWLETALYTLERRKGRGVEPGSARRYLETIARHRRRALDAWPVKHA